MISTRKRIPALFRWSVKDGLGANGKLVARSYSSELEGVFTRAGYKEVLDRNGRYVSKVHSAPPLGYVHNASGVLVPVLHAETASTNVCVRARDFTHAAWDDNSASHTTTAAAARGPDGLMSGTLVSGLYLSQGVAFTADGTKVYYWIVKRNTATETLCQLIDLDGGQLWNILVTWTGSVPSVASTGSTLGGTLFTPLLLFDDYYVLARTCESVVATNDNQMALYPGGEGETGSVYVWHAQAENASFPSSPINSVATALARVADSLYFDFKALPQVLTLYAKQVNVGAFLASALSKTYLQIGSATLGADPRLVLYGSSSNGNVGVQYDDATTTVNSEINPSAVRGDVVEARATLSATWTVRTHYSKNGAAEVSGTETSASGPSTAWNAERIYLAGLSSGGGLVAYQQVVIAAGVKTMAEMRALAESD